MKNFIGISFLIVFFQTTISHAQSHKAIPVGSVSNEISYGYYEYLPKDYAISDNWPMIIVLADESESGDGTVASLDALLNNGIAREINEGRDLPFVVLSVQTKYFWKSELINDFVTFSLDHYKVDPTKLFMTGYGEWGGTGLWSYAYLYPFRPAAIVPVDGQFLSNQVPCNLKDVASWIFFGETNTRRTSAINYENIVNSECSPAPTAEIKITLYPGVSTSCSYTTYSGDGGYDIYSWLLTKDNTGFPNQIPTADAGSDKYVQLPNNAVTLTGDSRDPDGDALNYSWEQVSGPNLSTIESPNNTSTSVTGLIAGEYQFLFKVIDDEGEFDTDSVNVTVVPVNANSNCDCDFIVESTMQTINPTILGWNVKGGQTICIRGGQRDWIAFENIIGEVGNPVTIKNCGGQVFIVNDTRNGVMSFKECKYFRFTGTGDPNFKYGIKVAKGGVDTAIRIGSGSTDFEFDHVEVAHAGFAGIMIKSDPSCSKPEYQRQNYEMKNVHVHHNYVHDTYGEGFYIGHYAYGGLDTGVECGIIYPHFINYLDLHDNITYNTGADGIQVACNPIGSKIYNNHIEKYGGDAFAPFQDNGLIVGQQALVYNNVIKDGLGKGAGMQIFGAGGHVVFNNVIINSPSMGIFCDERTKDQGIDGPYHFYNNTIINSGNGGMRLYADAVPNNYVKNNLIIDENELYILPLNGDVKLEETNNYVTANIDELKFFNADNFDLRLSQDSPAIDYGTDLKSEGITYDMLYIARPIGNGWDAGAYEYSSNSNQNIIPNANAGEDIQIVLPNNAASLLGIGTDPDGAITEFQWEKISGPSVTTSDMSQASVDLTDLVEGIYTFRLTVTDDKGANNFDDITITVLGDGSSNLSPAISLNIDDNNHLFEQGDNNAMLIGSAQDPDGTIINSYWNSVDSFGVHNYYSASDTLLLSQLDPGEYSFEYIAIDNDSAISSKLIGIIIQYPESDYYNIPNIFSPDGNGISDEWEIENPDNLAGCVIRVFSRFGNPVFESNGYDKNWDGTYNGDVLPEGDYYYTINCNDENKNRNGGVRIIKSH